ncbi:integral membrane protein [Streptomyces sp. MMG1121]|nr:integral membrane protein [Streptomyces sp. MMG1121]
MIRRLRPGRAGASGTAHELAVRHRLLLALSALLTLALFLSYEGVHGDADPLRTSSAPAVLSIDTALYALGQAQQDAGAAAPTSDFQKQISVAAQSLAAAAGDDVGGTAGRQALQTVAGLITVYAVKVQQAQLQPADSVLREAYLSYATSVLTDQGSGIQARLTALRTQQRAAVHRQTSFGPWLWLGWSMTLLLAVALATALLETQLFLRRRFRRRYNRGLLAAGTLLVAWVGTALLFTAWTHRGMARTRALLDRPLTGQLITDAGRHTTSYLAHTGFRASAAVGILIGGILLMTLAETGLRRHIDDYRFRPR